MTITQEQQAEEYPSTYSAEISSENNQAMNDYQDSHGDSDTQSKDLEQGFAEQQGEIEESAVPQRSNCPDASCNIDASSQCIEESGNNLNHLPTERDGACILTKIIQQQEDTIYQQNQKIIEQEQFILYLQQEYQSSQANFLLNEIRDLYEKNIQALNQQIEEANAKNENLQNINQKILEDLKKFRNSFVAETMAPWYNMLLSLYNDISDISDKYGQNTYAIQSSSYRNLLDEYEKLKITIRLQLEYINFELIIPEPGDEFDSNSMKCIRSVDCTDPQKKDKVKKCIKVGCYNCNNQKIIQYACVETWKNEVK